MRMHWDNDGHVLSPQSGLICGSCIITSGALGKAPPQPQNSVSLSAKRWAVATAISKLLAHKDLPLPLSSKCIGSWMLAPVSASTPTPSLPSCVFDPHLLLLNLSLSLSSFPRVVDFLSVVSLLHAIRRLCRAMSNNCNNNYCLFSLFLMSAPY